VRVRRSHSQSTAELILWVTFLPQAVSGNKTAAGILLQGIATPRLKPLKIRISSLGFRKARDLN
jgi:hypothetical protein